MVKLSALVHSFLQLPPAGQLQGFGNEENGTTVHSLHADSAYLFGPEEEAQENTILSLGIIVVAICTVAACVEVLSSWIEKKLAKRDYVEVVHRLYKELMILGVCAITVFLLKVTTLVNLITGSATDAVFDYAFALLAFSMLTYLAIVVLVMFQTNRHIGHWQEFEKLEFDYVERNYRENLASPYAYQYHLLRRAFIASEKLRASFPMDKYLRKSGMQIISDLSTIHWSVWVCIMLAALVNTVRVAVIDIDIFGGSIAYLLFAWLNVGLALAMFFKCRFIWNDLIASLKEDEKSGLLSAGADVSASYSHAKLFWLESPLTVTVPMQLVFILEAILVPLYFCHYMLYWTTYATGINVGFQILSIVPMILVLGVIVPLTVRYYILARCVGYLTHKKVVNKIEEHHKVTVFKNEEAERQMLAEKRRHDAEAQKSLLLAEEEDRRLAQLRAAQAAQATYDDSDLVLNWHAGPQS